MGIRDDVSVPSPQVLICGDVRLDSARGLLGGPAGEQLVEPRTAALLLCFLRTPDAVLSRESLFAEAWRERVVSAGALHVAISEVRKVLLASGSQQLNLKTHPRRGYELCVAAPTTAVGEPANARSVHRSLRGVAVSGFAAVLLAFLYGSTPGLGADLVCFAADLRAVHRNTPLAAPRMCLRAGEPASLAVGEDFLLRIEAERRFWSRWHLDLQLRHDSRQMTGQVLLAANEVIHYRFTDGSRNASGLDVELRLIDPSRLRGRAAKPALAER